MRNRKPEPRRETSSLQNRVFNYLCEVGAPKGTAEIAEVIERSPFAVLAAVNGLIRRGMAERLMPETFAAPSLYRAKT